MADQKLFAAGGPVPPGIAAAIKAESHARFPAAADAERFTRWALQGYAGVDRTPFHATSRAGYDYGSRLAVAAGIERRHPYPRWDTLPAEVAAVTK